MKNEYTVVNGTSYYKGTDENVINVLERARINKNRIRIWLGENGKSWNEEHDIIGCVGRSTGDSKIPLLIHNSRCYGGGSILTHCIVKIVDITTKRKLYQHENFSQSLFTFTGNTVKQDGKDFAPCCKNEESAKRLCGFMNGERNSK